MRYETFKSFVLIVLVGISFILSFILWSYKPNYDLLYDADYINEVDVGGKEKTKQELLYPQQMIFNNGVNLSEFETPSQMHSFFKDITSWVMYDFKESNANGFNTDRPYVQVKYAHEVPAQVLDSIFSFNEDIQEVDWNFKSVYFTLNEKNQAIKMTVLSENESKKITATIDKTEAYQAVVKKFQANQDELTELARLTVNGKDIEIPADEVEVPEKTVIATKIKPELFINALFNDPSLVTPNIRENYYTDGQRGLRMLQDDLRMEYVNPLQSNYDAMEPAELIDYSVTNINEQKGWTNNFTFDGVEGYTNHIQYRMTYEGYLVYDNYALSLIEQEWRNQALYKYSRPMIEVGNVLNSKDVTLPSGESVLETIKSNPKKLKLDKIQDIRIGYFLNYVNDVRSITLEPSWIIIYDDDWIKFDPEDYHDVSRRGEA